MALIVAVVLLVLAIGALLFSNAPVRDIVREAWRAFGHWWNWQPGQRRKTSNLKL